MDRQDFETRIASLRSELYGIAFRITGSADTAEDLAQETLMKLWCLRDRLDSYKSPAALAAIIVRNKALDHLRQTKSAPAELPDEVPAQFEASPEEILIESENDNMADRLMAMLPEGMRCVIRMRHIEGLEIAEIAAVTGSTEAAVRTALCRARQRVRQMFIHNKE